MLRPTTLTALRAIAGIGDKKLEHYGDDLVALVKAAPV
jgi:ATP-dependent DNA helicase RecQ